MTRIIVAHEGKQHSFRTAEALLKVGFLDKYITTIYDKPWSLTRMVKHVLRGGAQKKCASHRTMALPDDMVKQMCEGRSLLRLFLSKTNVFNKVIPRYYDWLHDSFGRRVAEYAIKHEVDAVIMYDTNANECWRILKERAPHIKRILDVTIANRLYTFEVNNKDADLFEDSRIIEETGYKETKETKKRLAEELELSDYFLAGSNFVKNSLTFSGVDEKRIVILPYGVNVAQFSEKTVYSTALPLKLIFVGGISYRKGIHHLLSVVSQYSEKEVELNLVGAYNANADYYKQYKDFKNIHFRGFVQHGELDKLYKEAHVFVLPSLAEGFAQVSLEAMASGLPVICTKNSGCNDAVTDFETGFVIDVSNRVQLKEKIDWFRNNMDKISTMGRKARKVALNYTWENYSRGLVKAVKGICANP